MPLLKLLSDGKFHSGVELGEALGVSRSAIWKRLKTLEDDLGVEVFKVPGRGYRLEEPLSLLDAERIAQEGGWPVTVLASIDSTNAEAQRRLPQQQPPFALLAEHQQAGRGRRGRAWVSPYGKNLYLTAVVSSPGGIQKLQALSLTMGLAVIRTLQQLGVEDTWGRRTKRMAGKAARQNLRVPSSMGGTPCRPSLMTTKFTPQARMTTSASNRSRGAIDNSLNAFR